MALRGTVQNDILKEYIARGTYIFPPAPSMRLITDLFRYCAAEVPHWNTISICGYHIREAGSTAVQEVAFTLANAIEYVKAAIDAGLAVDDFGPQLAFFFNAHNNLLEEVAKFRAARRLWAKIMRDRFGAKDPKSWQLRFHTQTAGSTLTAQQPENNVVRVTLQALAAVLGGTQSLHTNSKDEALALPSEAAVEVALRTQQIIAHESGVADTVDPLAGSYYVEHLTDEIERRGAGLYRAHRRDGRARARPSRPATSRTRSRTRPMPRCERSRAASRSSSGSTSSRTHSRARALPLTCSGSMKRFRPSKSPGFVPCGPVGTPSKLPTPWPASRPPHENPSRAAHAALRGGGLRATRHWAKSAIPPRGVRRISGHKHEETTNQPHVFRVRGKQPGGRARALLRARGRLGAGPLHAGRAAPGLPGPHARRRDHRHPGRDASAGRS